MNQVVIKVIGNYSYQTSKCLGQGVYGKVYEGMERQTKQKVAIKKIDLATFTNDKYLQNAIFSEIYLLKRFNHPNIVKFKDVLSSKNSLYIITQFCKNGDLKELIKRKKFKEEEAFQIMYQIMNGFSQLIRQKIVHRDLKPANILINEGTYKIGDFGFAKYVDNFGSQMLKSCVGSPIYMAPQILQRTQYTTKCDIWSLGIIFYQMLFGYPPWKARDESQLLRGIKTIPISHILKRVSVSSKASQFLKRTLAYSEQQRIGWGQLFQSFNPKTQYKSLQNLQKLVSQKDRSGRVTSTSTGWNSQNPNTSSNNITNKTSNILTNSPITTKYQANSMKNVSGVNVSGTQKRQTYSSSQQQMENVVLWRQFCIYYHYYTVELFTNFNVVKNMLSSIQPYCHLLLVLSMLVKYKSTYCLSLLSIHYKGAKNLQQLYKKMKIQHDSYQMIYSQISNKLDSQNQGKNIRNQIYNVIGRSEVINEEKNQKLQNFMIKVANQNAQILSDEVRKRAKSLKQIKIVQILNFVIQVMTLGIGKLKALKQARQGPRMEQQDFKDYITRVISKLDRLTMNV